jgi:hypothetical protein
LNPIKGRKSSAEISALTNHEFNFSSVGGEVWLINRSTNASNDSAVQSTGWGVSSSVFRWVDKLELRLECSENLDTQQAENLIAFEEELVKKLPLNK